MAARCRQASCVAKRALHDQKSSENRSGPEATTLPPEGAPLTDAEWEKVEPLLPPQRFTGGRPYNDHRTVLGGILWVARTESSWREMPREYGKWETAYRRYELWVNQRLWPRILEALGEEDLAGPTTEEAN